jgi:F0F1-type ATP synthase membrane subunit b/b'
VSPTVTTFLFEAANFLVLAAVLGWLFFKPVRQAIADHRTKFEADNQHAAQNLAESETMRKEIQDAHANLQTELNERRAIELATIKVQADQVLAEAHAAADREREQSHLQAARMSDSQRDTLAEVAAAAAASAVGELLQQINGPELQSALIQSACRQLEQLSQDSIAPVKIESASPLSAEQIAAIKSQLGAAGNSADFRTAEEIGVGVRISTANGLIDASASGLSHFTRHSLVKELQHRANNHNPMQSVNDA